MREVDGVSARGLIQIRSGGVPTEFRVLVAHAPNPLALRHHRGLGRERLDQIGHRSDAGRAQVDRSEGRRIRISGARMHVRIDEPRSDRASFGVDHLRGFSHPATDLRRGAHGDELVSEDREGLGSRTRAVDGDHVPVQHH
jgi:hypothetical protein